MRALARRLIGFSAFALVMPAAIAVAQEPFPEGIEGEHYYCPRIDLNPASHGGPLTITLDGVLDDDAWQRATYQHWSQITPARDFTPPEEDLDFSWAAFADSEYLYIGWKVVDENLQVAESSSCGVWEDDSVEVYIDANNDGPDCGGAGASCYQTDDAQFTVGANQVGKFDPVDPDLIEFGGVAGKGSCDFNGAAPEVLRGVCLGLDPSDGPAGWQGEIAIALDTLGNLGDGTPEWHVKPLHGTTIGFSLQENDDDNGASRDHKLIWAAKEVVESAWYNPGAFGKLQFVVAGTPLVAVTRDVPDELTNGGSGTATIVTKPIPGFGTGVVVITETMPPGFTAANPSNGGVLAGDTITWSLGQVTGEITVSYTITAGQDSIDGLFPGKATINGIEIAISGDTSYRGSPTSTKGFIKLWQHLGPLSTGSQDTAFSCSPGPDLALDWIVNADESITETNIMPFPGQLVRPKYLGDGVVPGGSGARSAGLARLGTGGVVDVVTDVFPAWKGGISLTETVDHASKSANGFDADNHLTLSCVYVTVSGPDPIDTAIGVGSDDSIQIFVDDVAVGQVDSCRAWGGGSEEQDVFPFTLTPGEHRVLVKVADGAVSSGFRLRFRKDPNDGAAGGLLPPQIRVSLTSSQSPPPAAVVRSVSAVETPFGEIVDVALNLTTVTASDVVLREVLPESSSAEAISDGGAVAGGTITWDLKAATTKGLTYKLVPSECGRDLQFGLSTWRVGPVEGLVGGTGSVRQTLKNEALGEWKSVDVADAAGATQRLADHAVVSQGAGAGIKSTADEFHFTHIERSGDFDLTARVDCLDGPGRAGLIVRDTLDPFSAEVFFGIERITTDTAVATFRALARAKTEPARAISPVNIAVTDRNVASLPVWMRLRRAGAAISLQRSSNGLDWTELGTRAIGTGTTQVALRDSALFGLVASGEGKGVTQVGFHEVSGPAFAGVAPPKGFRRGDSDANEAIELTDAISLLNYLFTGGVKPVCLDAADFDDNGEADISDAISNLNYQFLGGGPPADPGPFTCGPDKNAEAPELGCDQACP